MNLDRYKHNAWKNSITGNVDANLKKEWESVTVCGFGNQKKLNLRPRLSLYCCFFVYPKFGPKSHVATFLILMYIYLLFFFSVILHCCNPVKEAATDGGGARDRRNDAPLPGKAD
jgi:hypothetical protein